MSADDSVLVGGPDGLPSFSIADWWATGYDADGSFWILTDCTGWDDTPDVRLTFPVRAGADGAFDAPGFYGPRVIVLTGTVLCDSRASLDRAKNRLSVVAHDLKVGADLIGYFPSGTYLVHVKRVASVKMTTGGARTMDWQLTLEAVDPLLYSQYLNSVTVTLAANAGTGGGAWKFPMRWPYGFAGQVGGGSGLLLVTNAGDASTWPTYTINGPGTNLTIADPVSGRYLKIATLPVGQFVVIDSRNRQVLLMGTQPRRDLLAPGSAWFPILGNTTHQLRFYADALTSATCTATWRSAWL